MMTSRRNGPNPTRYGRWRPVRLRPRSVRPWNEVRKETSHARPVAARAIFTAFSIASDPLFRKIDFDRPRGAIFAIAFARSMYGSYNATMKGVGVHAAG